MNRGSSFVRAENTKQMLAHYIRSERINAERQCDDHFDAINFDSVSVCQSQVPFRIIRSDYAAFTYGFDCRPNRRSDNTE